mmetsp:Transcript_51915/g.151204  ORF Transcript_51915/g.151204 Transcript_51915/m.151204 type:complete len:380 (-) Transcript_51915:2839-3978(-)
MVCMCAHSSAPSATCALNPTNCSATEARAAITSCKSHFTCSSSAFRLPMSLDSSERRSSLALWVLLSLTSCSLACCNSLSTVSFSSSRFNAFTSSTLRSSRSAVTSCARAATSCAVTSDLADRCKAASRSELTAAQCRATSENSCSKCMNWFSNCSLEDSASDFANSTELALADSSVRHMLASASKLARPRSSSACRTRMVRSTTSDSISTVHNLVVASEHSDASSATRRIATSWLTCAALCCCSSSSNRPARSSRSAAAALARPAASCATISACASSCRASASSPLTTLHRCKASSKSLASIARHSPCWDPQLLPASGSSSNASFPIGSTIFPASFSWMTCSAFSYLADKSVKLSVAATFSKITACRLDSYSAHRRRK